MDKIQPSERLLCVTAKDREGKLKEYVVGSVIQVNNTWIFYKRIIPQRDILRIRGVWGIDVRILKALKSEGIEEIHCYDDEAKELFIGKVADFDQHGETLKLRTTQVYLPLTHWVKTKKRYRTSSIPNRQVLN